MRYLFALLLLVIFSACSSYSALHSSFNHALPAPDNSRQEINAALARRLNHHLPLRVLYRMEVQTPLTTEVYREALTVENLTRYRIDLFASNFFLLTALIVYDLPELTLINPQTKSAFQGITSVEIMEQIFGIELLPEEFLAWSLGYLLPLSQHSAIRLDLDGSMIILRETSYGSCLLTHLQDRILEQELVNCQDNSIKARAVYTYADSLDSTLPTVITLSLPQTNTTIIFTRERLETSQPLGSIKDHISFEIPTSYDRHPLEAVTEAERFFN